MMKTKVFEGGFCNLHPSDCNPFATATRHYLNIASWTRGGMEDKIVDFIFDSMRRSISFMDGIQKQNEKAVRIMLDYSVAAREQAAARHVGRDALVAHVVRHDQHNIGLPGRLGARQSCQCKNKNSDPVFHTCGRQTLRENRGRHNADPRHRSHVEYPLLGRRSDKSGSRLWRAVRPVLVRAFLRHSPVSPP